MRVSQVMTVPPVQIRSDATLYQAAEVVALAAVSDLMVVAETDEFVGVLSEGDILRSALPDIDEILAEGGTLDAAYALFLKRGRTISTMLIDPLVIHDPIMVDPDDHVAKAAAALSERMIRRLPVVQNGRLLGTVSRADLCRAVVGSLQRKP